MDRGCTALYMLMMANLEITLPRVDLFYNFLPSFVDFQTFYIGSHDSYNRTCLSIDKFRWVARFVTEIELCLIMLSPSIVSSTTAATLVWHY